MSICAVVMAGGYGTRLWPLSRASHPKQFLTLHGQGSMLQQTFDRIKSLEITSSITICNESHRFLVADQLHEIGKLDSIIVEPVGKNTAPAVCLAALHAIEEDPLLLVLAADHIIQDQSAFEKSIRDAIPLAESGKLVSFGIKPNEPHTGYGYIKKGVGVGSGFVVDKFIEKPTTKKAEKFIASKNYFWNSGMFLFKASIYLEELKKLRPDILVACESSMPRTSSNSDFLHINKEDFMNCPSDSIDYAVMEKTENAVVVPMDANWSDIGSWSALWNISNKDSEGNVESGDVLLHNSKNCYVRSDQRFTAALGLNNMIVVDTKDALLVASMDAVQDTKFIVQRLKEDLRSEWELHREVVRPWGSYDCIDQGKNFQVKRIIVKPYEKLSLQKHQFRDEHWVVVSGIAKVTNGEETFLLSENESTFIPAGVIHSLENPEDKELQIIEVQTGSYLCEDDIVRFQDKYGREKL